MDEENDKDEANSDNARKENDNEGNSTKKTKAYWKWCRWDSENQCNICQAFLETDAWIPESPFHTPSIPNCRNPLHAAHEHLHEVN